MNFYVWNKEDSIMGLSAQTLFASRPDFKYDDVIVIHKEGDKNNVVMIETAGELRLTYDIESEDSTVIGFVVAVILTQENKETIKEQLKELDEENKLSHEDEDVVDEYTRLLEDLLNKELENQFEDEVFIPVEGEYNDPQCKITDLSDLKGDLGEKKLILVLKHAFVTESTDLLSLKCMHSFNEQLKELEEKREKYIQEADFGSAELTEHQIENLKFEVMDSCDATLKIDVDKIYQYDNVIIADCCNGQTIIIDGAVVNSARTSAIEYEKTNNNQRYRVHYRSLDVVLNECYNEVIERGNTVFVISI